MTEPMVNRGILLDMPKTLAVGRLAPAYGITAEELQKALGKWTLNPGDVAWSGRTSSNCIRIMLRSTAARRVCRVSLG
jgi:hypothetical protein